MKIHFQFMIMCFLAVTICSSCIEESSLPISNTYFDLTNYISELKKNGDEKKGHITKFVQFNDTKDSLELENYDLSVELDLMKKYNINTASLSGKYEIDEAIIDGIKTTTYTALENNLLTRSLAIVTQNEQVNRIEITAFQKSILSESKQAIIFEPDHSFLLKSEDKNKYSNDLMKEILIKF